MLSRLLQAAVWYAATFSVANATPLAPIPNRFNQEIAQRFTTLDGLPGNDIQLIDLAPGQPVRIYAADRWAQLRAGHWEPAPNLTPPSPDRFTLADAQGNSLTVAVKGCEVLQILRHESQLFVITSAEPFRIADGQLQSMGWPSRFRVHQAAVAPDGTLVIASSDGLFQRHDQGWSRLEARDDRGRVWSSHDVLGVTFDSRDRLWLATHAGVGVRTADGWRFFEGKDGLPYNDFTGLAAGPDGAVWMATRRGLIRFDQTDWHYRQGPRWLPDDHIRQIVIDASGRVWLATAAGLGFIEHRSMTLAEKAALYENEIERYIKRTPLGYVAEALLQTPADKSTVNPQDSDNDGLWTAMYGAAQCFAFAATQDPAAQLRAEGAFRALKFLQTVTQGGSHSPPDGYVARTIRPIDWPDPNVGRVERDREEQKGDRLWKVYEPRWPKSADGQWFWKSDTSSDELDGHYFFYPLYYDFCAESDTEKQEVRAVVRKLTDHLLRHSYVLIDHDGKPTRWAIFGPQYLNRDPDWWAERGLNSLSILSYLAVASHVTGDPRYAAASRELIDQHGYAQNAMYPKVQHGPGSGNQSDDEMAFMCYYSLLRYSRDEELKAQIRFSFFRYWANEAPELNPFFNIAYAAHNLGATMTINWGTFPLSPWDGWLEDSRATLYGFPLDRLNWPHQNSHRLDIVPLGLAQARDLYEAGRGHRGHRVNGKVLPVENRHFNHWNTDPWQLDYGGHGNELAAGTVFLLPYHLGVYHGFIEKP
jgi:hypothetical protein